MLDRIKSLKNSIKQVFNQHGDIKITSKAYLLDVEDKLVKSEENIPLESLKEALSPEEIKKAADRDAFMKIAQPGDVLLSKNVGNFSISVLFKVVEWTAFNSPWSHAGMYIGNGTVIDATGRRDVSKRDLEDYFNFYKTSIYRPNYKSEEDKQKAISFMEKEIGTPFDTKFNLENNDKVYCTKLVYKALLSVFDEGKKEDPLLPLDTALNKKLVTPMTFMNSPLLKKVEVPDEKNYYWSVTKKELKTAKFIKILQRVFHRDNYIKNAAFNAHKLAMSTVGTVAKGVAKSIYNLEMPPI